MLSDHEILSMYSKAKGRVMDLATMNAQEWNTAKLIRKVEQYYSMQGGRGLSRQIVALCIALGEENCDKKTYQVTLEGYDDTVENEHLLLWINCSNEFTVKEFLREKEYKYTSIEKISTKAENDGVDFTL